VVFVIYETPQTVTTRY